MLQFILSAEYLLLPLDKFVLRFKYCPLPSLSLDLI